MPFSNPPSAATVNLAISVDFKEVPDNYSVRENINKATGQIHRTYLYKRKPCYRVPIVSPLARQLAGYTLIEKDLRSAILWAQKLQILYDGPKDRSTPFFGRGEDRKKYTLIKALTVSTLTFYGKCFAQAEGRRVKLERRQIDKEFHDMHDKVIEYRNNFAAHSGALGAEKSEVVLVFPVDKRQIAQPKIYRELNQPDYIGAPQGEVQLIELLEHVRAFVNQKIDQLAKKLLGDEVAPVARETWISRIK